MKSTKNKKITAFLLLTVFLLAAMLSSCNY